MSNVLRLLVFQPLEKRSAAIDRVTVCNFEVDDQTPEDLAAALERLRALDGVLDVVQAPAFGKKGRVSVQVQVLARPGARAQVIDEVFAQTTTLGVRWHEVSRTILPRDVVRVGEDGNSVRVKRTLRPGGNLTVKAEMDDVASLPGGRDARERMRNEAERAARIVLHEDRDEG